MSKFIARAVGVLATFAPLTALAYYYDDYYDDYYYDDYYYSEPSFWATGIGIFVIILLSLFALVGLVLFVFWIFMLIDCVKREFEQKNTWLIILIVSFFFNLTWLSAVLYYFMVKRKDLGTKPAPAPAAPKPEETKAPEPPKTEAPKQ